MDELQGCPVYPLEQPPNPGSGKDPSRQDFLHFHNAAAAPGKLWRDELTPGFLCPAHAVPNLVPGTAAASWPNPTTRKVLLTRGEFTALWAQGSQLSLSSFLHSFSPLLLLIPGPSSSISTLSTRDEEQASAGEI